MFQQGNGAEPKKNCKSQEKDYQNAVNELHNWRLPIRNISTTTGKLLLSHVTGEHWPCDSKKSQDLLEADKTKIEVFE